MTQHEKFIFQWENEQDELKSRKGEGENNVEKAINGLPSSQKGLWLSCK